MSEKLPGLKILGKIDLDKLSESKWDNKPQVPRPEKYSPDLKTSLRSMSERLNSEYGDFCTADGQMKMIGRDADYDQERMAEKIKGFAEDEFKTPEKFLADREKNPSNITEIAMTLLFNKILGQEFVTVRASTYDDYENGADQLIIDKKTGAVVCGVDDVIGNVGDDGGEKKEEKMRRKMIEGKGARIKYGATCQNGKLIRKELGHIPLFYLALSKVELNNLLKSLTADSALAVSDQTEKSVYAKLVYSLKQQAQEYVYNKNLDPRLRDNLGNFDRSLAKMIAYAQ
ncbi:MAG: hypothetical protein WC863_04560 [Patescibacteria group bacterium]